MHIRRLLAPLCFVLALVACDDIKAVFSLSQALQAEYHVSPNVKISNRTHLVISFRNLDESMKWDSTGRAAFAHNVAVFAKKHYARASTLEDISVAFIKVSEAGPLSITRSDAPFTFPVDSLR